MGRRRWVLRETMERRVRAYLLASGIASLCIGCGDSPAEPSPTSDPASTSGVAVSTTPLPRSDPPGSAPPDSTPSSTDVPDPAAADPEAARRRSLVGELDQLLRDLDRFEDAQWEELRARLVAEGDAVLPYVFELPTDSPAWSLVFEMGEGLLSRMGDPAVPLVCSLLDRSDTGSEVVDWAVLHLEFAENTWREDTQAARVLGSVLGVLLRGRAAAEAASSGDPAPRSIDDLALDESALVDLLLDHGDRAPDAIEGQLRAYLTHVLTHSPSDAQRLVSRLASWGPDARVVAPVVLDRWDDFEWEEPPIEFLTALAGQVPEALPRLMDLVGSGDAVNRDSLQLLDVVRAVHAWGPTAEAARPALVTLFREGDVYDKKRAAAALAALGDPSHEVRVALLDTDAWGLAQLALAGDMLRRPEVYLGLLPTLDVRSAETCAQVLALTHPERSVEIGRLLLDRADPSERVSATAVQDVFREPTPEFVQFVSELASSNDSDVARSATAWLRSIDPDSEREPERGPRSLPELLEELDRQVAEDPWVARELVARIADTPGSIPELSMETVLALVSMDDPAALDVVRRSDSHVQVSEAVLRHLLRDDDPALESIDGDHVAAALRAMGSRAGGLREYVTTRIEALGDRLEVWDREHVEAVFADLDEDALRLALLSSKYDPYVVRRLLELGAHDALVVYVGREGIDEKHVPLDVEGVSWAVRRALAADEHDPHRALRRLGAVWLLSRIPPSEAHERAREALGDPDPYLRHVVASALASGAVVHDVAVPPDLLELMARDATCHPGLLSYVRTTGRSSPHITRALSHVSRHGADVDRISAARLWMGRGADPQRAAAVVRDALEALEHAWLTELGEDSYDPGPHYAYVDRWYSDDPWTGESFTLPWEDVVAVLWAVPAEPADVERILGVIPPGPACELLPLIERLGPAAASAVPTLRRWLRGEPEFMLPKSRRTPLSSDVFHEYAAIDVLAAIGPAAHEAVADIRLWMLDADKPYRGAVALRAILGE